MDKKSKIFVAGHRGLVGSAICRCLGNNGYDNLLVRERAELDLTRQDLVERFFDVERPKYVFIAAAKVGGILANNTYRADFICSNLAIQTNIIHAAYQFGVQRLLFLGSSCIYPKSCPQPIRESYLLTSSLEPTNEPYAIAKIAGLKMCEAFNTQYGTEFMSVMPTNLYGPNDNFDLNNSHVIPALIRKFVEAKRKNDSSVTLWGTGNPRREFMHVDDAADAMLHLMNLPFDVYRDTGLSHVNLGCGADIAIAELADMIRSHVDFKGELRFDASKPDGTPQKVLDVSVLSSLGWKARIKLEDGIKNTIDWYVDCLDNSRMPEVRGC